MLMSVMENPRCGELPFPPNATYEAMRRWKASDYIGSQNGAWAYCWSLSGILTPRKAMRDVDGLVESGYRVSEEIVNEVKEILRRRE